LPFQAITAPANPLVVSVVVNTASVNPVPGLARTRLDLHPP